MTEGKKFDSGKPRMELISNIAMRELGQVAAFGAVKYGDYNWAHGIKWTKILASILRHTFAFLWGEDKDSESGLSHMAHAMFDCMQVLHYETTHKELDDRFKVVLCPTSQEKNETI